MLFMQGCEIGPTLGNGRSNEKLHLQFLNFDWRSMAYKQNELKFRVKSECLPQGDICTINFFKFKHLLL